MQKKNIDLLTGKKIPKNLSSTEKRLAALGLDDESLIDKIKYLEEELKVALEKNYRLEKEIIKLKKEKSAMWSSLKSKDGFKIGGNFG